MLFNGDAVPKDWVTAYALMVRASQAGLDAAAKALAQMDQYLPLADRQAGGALARNYEEAYNRGGLPLPPVDLAQAGRVPPAADPAAPPRRPAARTAAGPTLTPARPAPVATTPAPVVAASGGWRLQLGAFGDPANATRLWSQLAARFPGRGVTYQRAGTLTKVLVGPYPSRAAAVAACGSVSPCVPVAR
jgi:uncharacterized protein